MGKLNAFQVHLNSNRQVFYPGEQLVGYVFIDLREPIEIRGIEIEFEGKGYCHWTETHGSGEDRRTEHYTGKEKLCEIESILYGSGGGGSRVVLPVGQQTFPFAINIPQGLPSSFEGSIGHIRYTFEAKIDRPWKFDHKVKRPIIINEVIDTNLPQYSMKPGGSVHKDVGCLCCEAGPLDMTVFIDRSCYCPGENILIAADVDNKTTRDMEALKAKLVQTITYRASSKSKTRTNTITKLNGQPIPQGQSVKWDNQPLQIPAIPPTIISSRVINVTYYVVVEVAVPWGLDPDQKMPITIGTVPYRAIYGQQVAPPPLQQGVQMDALPPPSYGSMAPPPPSIFPDMPPPAYAAVAGQGEISIAGDNDQYTYGNLSYAPVYTYAQPSQVPITEQPGGYPPPQQPGGYPPPQQPGGYPPPQQPGGYPPPQQPDGYAPPPQQPGGYPPPQQPGGYAPPPQQPGASAPPPQQMNYPPPSAPGYPTPVEQLPYNPNAQQEAAPISKPPLE